jgi:hypothetical protein
VANAHITLQLLHVPGAKYIPHETDIFTKKYTLTIAGDDSSGILSAVLNNSQTAVNRLIHE